MAGLRSAVYRTLVGVEKLVSATRVGRKLKRTSVASGVYRSIYKACKPAGTVTTTILGHKLHLDPGDLQITRCLLVYGEAWERQQTEIFVSLVRNGMAVVDVGANLGYYTLLAARAVGSQGRVYAFEPDPKNYALLCRNVQENGYANVVSVRKAISDRSGTARLHLSDENFGSHTLSERSKNGTVVEVETVSLDDYFADFSGQIGVLKIDAEGAEELILDGMTALLSRCPELILLTEFFPRAIQAFGRSPEKYVKRLHAYGFKMFSFYGAERAIHPVDLDHLPSLIEPLVGEGTQRDHVDLLCVRGDGLPQLEWLRSASQSSQSSPITTETQGTILRV